MGRLNKIIEEYKSKVKDLEYREGELTTENGNEIGQKLKESLSNTQSLQEKVEKISIEFIEMKGKSFDQLQKFDFHIQELQQVIREKDTEIKLLKSNIPSDQIDQVNTHENIFVSNTSQLPVTSSDIN